MKRSVLFLFFICSILFSKAQLTYQWANSVGSSANSEYGQAIASDPSGNVYVAGAFTGVVDFDPSAATANLTSLSGSQDIFLAKYTSTGAFIWVKQIAGTNTEKPYDLVADASGAYLAGNFLGTVDFDPNVGVNNITFLGGGTDGDGFFAKYDVNGNLSWVDRIGSTVNDRVTSIAIDASANVYVTGFIGGNADMDPSASSASLNVSGTYNAYIGKYSSTGAYIFAKQITGGYSEGDDINVDASGNIYLTGSYATTNDFDPSAATANLSTSSLTQLDIFLAKYTSAGLYTFAKQIGGIGVDIGYQVRPDASGNIYLGGVFSSTCDFDPTATVNSLTSAGQGDLFVAKYDVSGNLTWKIGTGGTTNDYCFGLGLDGSNNVYITGKVQGTNIDFDPSASSSLLTSASSCMYIASYSSAGNFLSLSSPTISSTGNGLCVNSSLYVTGMFAGTGDFDFSASTANLTSVGSDDVFFAKYNTCIGSPPAQPSPIAGNFTVCSGSSQTYSVTNDPLATSYTWAFPVGWTNLSTTNVSVPTVSNGGIVSVVANNACGVSPASTVSISSMVISTSSITANCNQFNGVASATASGGVPAYSYTWSTGFVGQTLSNIAAGTYTVNVKDANNCLVTTTVVIPNASGPIVGISSFTNPSCFGSNNGIATTTTSGGAAGPGFPTYLWSNGQNTPTATNLLTGVYTVTLTDAAGCVASASVSIMQPSSLTINLNGTNPKCFNAANGTATANVLGGTPGYTYTWSPTPGAGGNTSTPSGMAPGNHVVTVTDAKGCVITGTVGLANPVQMLSSVSLTNVGCFGACNGSAITSLTNAVGAVSYFWTGGSSTLTTQSVSNLCAGTYTMLATDQNSCTSTTIFNITQPPLLTVNISAVGSVSCSGGNNGFATVSASGGTPAYTYSWSNSQTSATTTNLSAGSYTVIVTDSKFCTATAIATITQPTGMTGVVTGTNVTCNGANNGIGSLTYTGGTAPYNVLWQPSLATTTLVNNLAPLTHTAFVTDANGCALAKILVITQPAALVVSTSATVTNCGQSNGSASVSVSGGAPGYTYLWSAGPTYTNALMSNVVAGAYTVTVKDANNCTQPAIAIINDIAGPTIVVTNTVPANCFGSSTGGATVSASGGIAPLTFLWSYLSQPTQNVSNLPAGVHTVTVTDQANCTSSATVNITQAASALVTSITSVTNIACNGQFNGAAQITASGGAPGYNYLWSPSPQTNSVLTGVPSGVYTCSVTDANGCVSTKTVSITQPLPLLVTTNTVVNNACFGYANAQIAMSISGGTPTYSISWSPALPATSTVSNLVAGSYTLFVVDIKGCSTNSVYTIVDPPALVILSTSTTVACSGPNGSASVIVAGGTPAYTYSWFPNSQSTNSATGLPTGNYVLTTTDAKGCIINASITIPAGINPTVTAISNASIICTGETSTLTASGASSYSWNTSAAAPSITVNPTTNTTYTVTGIASNGCSASATITQSVSLCTGINSSFAGKNSELKIYPNPFTHEITLIINDLEENVNLKIYNSFGQLVYFTNVSNPQSVMDLKHLPAGIYFVRVEMSEEVELIKLVKE